MPQVDLETLVCGGTSCDNKVSCTTTSATVDNIDFPPDSFWVSKDQEQDWLDNNAFIERKNSGKSSAPQPGLNPGSQRFSLNFKSKASLIGLPKPSKTNFVDLKYRKKCETRLFPSRIGSRGKPDGSVVEPGSPNVSCIGRVRSRRKRNSRVDGKRKSGLFAKCRSIFGFCSKKKQAGQKCDDKHDVLKRLPASEVDEPRRSAADSEPVRLGGMKRFVSGRKSDSWVDAGVARF